MKNQNITNSKSKLTIRANKAWETRRMKQKMKKKFDQKAEMLSNRAKKAWETRRKQQKAKSKCANVMTSKCNAYTKNNTTLNEVKDILNKMISCGDVVKTYCSKQKDYIYKLAENVCTSKKTKKVKLNCDKKFKPFKLSVTGNYSTGAKKAWATRKANKS